MYFVLEVTVEGLHQICCRLRGAIKGFSWDIASRNIWSCHFDKCMDEWLDISGFSPQRAALDEAVRCEKRIPQTMQVTKRSSLL